MEVFQTVATADGRGEVYWAQGDTGNQFTVMAMGAPSFSPSNRIRNFLPDPKGPIYFSCASHTDCASAIDA